MKVVTFSAIKGGVGKSSMAILTANYLSNAGYKVLVIDLDIQNSLSFYYYPEYVKDFDKMNIANAINNNDLKGNIYKGDLFIDIIPSSFNLVNLRAVNIKTLQRMKDQISNDYNYCIIDTSPTLDNIVLNALNFSDYIITPAFLTQFDFKSLQFYRDQINNETDKINNWNILLNRFKEPKTDNPETEINQYLDLFNSEFDNILNAKIQETHLIQKAIDFKTRISKAKAKEKLFIHIQDLLKELLNIDKEPDSF